MARCEVCHNSFNRKLVKRGSPKNLCKLCIRLKYAELRFHPYILIKKVIKSRSINSLSTVELMELNIAGVFKKFPALRYHPLLDRLAEYLVQCFEV